MSPDSTAWQFSPGEGGEIPVAITYAPNQNLSNFFNQLDTIKSSGDFNVPMKLPPPPKVTMPPGSPTGPLGGSVLGGGLSRSPSGVVRSVGQLDTLSRLLAAIRKQESSGNYQARNSMSGAAGGYQVMPSNFVSTGSGWDMEALGHDVSLSQFLSSPQIQDQIARYKLGQYLKQFGSPEAAAVAWYGGPGAVKNMYSKTTQAGGYPSLYAYWQSVLAKM